MDEFLSWLGLYVRNPKKQRNPYKGNIGIIIIMHFGGGSEANSSYGRLGSRVRQRVNSPPSATSIRVAPIS